jgi:hypothetical protein
MSQHPARSGIVAAPLDRWLALGGVIGPVLFVITFTVAGLARPGYSPVDQAISDLGIACGGQRRSAAPLAPCALETLLAAHCGYRCHTAMKTAFSTTTIVNAAPKT